MATMFKRSGRWWADLRDFADVGGKREPLRPIGAARATDSKDLAKVLFGQRLRELEAARLGMAVAGLGADSRQVTRAGKPLGAACEAYLVERASAENRPTDRHLANVERCLTAACRFFGEKRVLGDITDDDVKRWLASLRQEGKGEQTRLHYLNALSNLFRVMLPGHVNPVRALGKRGLPVVPKHEAKWLEVHDAALLLEAARTYRPARPGMAMPFAYELLATFLLTGGRKSEVLGLTWDDISFDRATVTFRPNDWRRLKTRESHRVVPLWPQLAEILGAYKQTTPFSTEPGALLFPSTRTQVGYVRTEPHLLDEPRKLYDAVGARIGHAPGAIRSKMFRHTYCAARAQTLDRGAPVAPDTVRRELGHTSDVLVRKVYGHLGTMRHRSEHVEYRVEHFREALGERLVALEPALAGSATR